MMDCSMEAPPARPSLVVTLALPVKPSLIVKLPLKQALKNMQVPPRRCETAETTTAGAAAEVDSRSDTQEPVTVQQTPTKHTMAQTASLLRDPRNFGRELSSRKRAAPPGYTTTVACGISAKKRKVKHDMVAEAPSPTRRPPTPVQMPTPPGDHDCDMTFQPPPAASCVDSLGKVRPLRDEHGDARYVELMQQELLAIIKHKRRTVHRRSAGRIRDLLLLAEYPSVGEAKFLSQDEALAELTPGSFFNGPIITAEQQPLPLSTVSEFLDEYYDDAAIVHIQDSAASTGRTGSWARSVTVRQVKDRFRLQRSPDQCPWNLLELATHHDDGLRPIFLSNEDSRLITKLKIPDSADETRRRKYEPGFKDVEKWALVAQAGALTEPHQDSHGYSTFITINQGCVGFGWLSHPSAEERAAWRRDPQHFRDGRWRYVVLKPGQTVFFPAGTVHLVFRLKAAGDSLAFGGHVLRCSNIVYWVKTLLEEHENQNIVNEDLGDSAVGYLERVERFVDQAEKQGREERWGGADSIAEFKSLKARFMRLPKPKTTPGKKTAKAMV